MARVAAVDVHPVVTSRGATATVIHLLGRWGELLPLAVLALVLRFWGLNWGLPYTLHPDEPVVFDTVAQMLQHHSLNPGTFTYPSALYYFFYAIGSVYSLIRGTSVGMAISTTGVGALAGAGSYTNPEAILWMRIGVALICTAAVLLVYVAARLFVGRLPATLGAILLAVSQVHIDLSQIATTDGPAATAMALIALLSIIAVLTERRLAFWLAWIAVGLALGVKYNAGAGVIMPLVAYSIVKLRHVQVGERLTLREFLNDQRLRGIVLLPVAFLVTTPFALIHPRTFVHDVAAVVLHYTVVGQLGGSGSSALDTLQVMVSWPELLLCALACLGILSALVRRHPATIVIASGALLYILVVATPKVYFFRNLVPLWPLLAILAAEGAAWLATLLGQLLNHVTALQSGRLPSRIIAILIVGLVVLVGLIPMAGETTQFDSNRASVDVRVVASEWITAHIPAGTRIADESYGVTLDPHRYTIDYQGTGLYEHPLAWYPEHGYTYVVASSIFFNRYFASGDPYPAARAYYETMITNWGTVVREFVGVNVVAGAYGSRIYVIQVPQPAAT